MEHDVGRCSCRLEHQTTGSLEKNTAGFPCNMQRSISRPNPLSLFGFRASKTVTPPRSSTTDMRASEETPPSPVLHPLCSPPIVSTLHGTLWCTSGRKTQAGGNGIVLRFWFDPIVTNNGGHVRARTRNVRQDR